MAFADACEAMGIPLEEAQSWAEKRLLNGDATSYQMRAVGQRALAKAVACLERLVDEGPRYSETTYDEKTGKPSSSRTPISTDLDAAKTLAKLASDSLKASGIAAPPPAGKGARLSVQLDLWDNPGNWSLKKPS